MARPASVEEYLEGLPDESRLALEKLRRVIRAALPEASEGIAWQMPAFRAHGRWLVGYAAFKDHCSFFPMSGAVIEGFAADLEGFTTTRGSIHFTAEKPLPAAVVKRIVRARVAEVAGRPQR